MRTKEEIKAYNKKWELKNKDRINALKRARNKANPEIGKLKREKNKEKIKSWKRAYYLRHKAAVLVRVAAYKKSNPECDKRYRAKNKDKLAARKAKAYRKDLDNSREKGRARAAEYRLKFPERVRKSRIKYSGKRRKVDLGYRLTDNLRRRIRKALAFAEVRKTQRTHTLMGCTPLFFKQHLEQQFTPQMSWENYGEYWQIDHIKALALFNLQDEEQQKAAFHFSNCRPLDCLTNIRLGVKLRHGMDSYRRLEKNHGINAPVASNRNSHGRPGGIRDHLPTRRNQGRGRHDNRSGVGNCSRGN